MKLNKLKLNKLKLNKLKFIKSLPFMLLSLILIVVTCGQFLPISFKSTALAISLICKEFIIFVLPFIIFSFVVSGLTELQSESFKLVAILLPLVCISNFAGLWVSYLASSPVLTHSVINISKLSVTNVLEPSFEFHLPTIIKNDYALVLAIGLAFTNNFLKSEFITNFNKQTGKCANFLLKKCICPILPLFVLGFIIKMQHEGTLIIMIKEYFVILLLVAVLAYGYIAILLCILCGKKSAFTKFKNLIPSVLIGLFSMSSAAAIPSTIEASEKNLEDPKIARFVVPAAANMHLLGDCFAIPIIACALMMSFGLPYPSPWLYLIFSLKGVMAKFAAAAIPGGSALVFVPILIDTFGFSSEMVTIFTTIYLIFDPVATSTNVFGHGMFAMLFEKVYKHFKK